MAGLPIAGAVIDDNAAGVNYCADWLTLIAKLPIDSRDSSFVTRQYLNSAGRIGMPEYHQKLVLVAWI
jgi:hypothetical protein